MEPAEGMRITVTENGPYEVEGSVPLVRRIIEPNEHGESWEWGEAETFDTGKTYRLCRCGQSNNKPFCDDSHLTNGFDGTEAAAHVAYMDQAVGYEGPTLTLTDAEAFCAYARFCDARGQIWRLVREEGEEAAELVKREAAHCPSGRLVAWRPVGDGQLERVGEPTFEPSIGVVEDPGAEVSGPLAVRGGIQVVSSDGYEYEVRNRMTLCRCGASENKPFCDGSHAAIGFTDGYLEQAGDRAETPA
jgi:CDGSH-type Zn-finger protein